MIYLVEISPLALAEAEEAYVWLQARSPQRAARWFTRLIDAINSLERNPTRCSLAPESDAFPTAVRQLLYGKRGGVYRILFTIAGDRVRVLHIRHAARKSLDASDD